MPPIEVAFFIYTTVVSKNYGSIDKLMAFSFGFVSFTLLLNRPV